jgi:hypothetical protein
MALQMAVALLALSVVASPSCVAKLVSCGPYINGTSPLPDTCCLRCAPPALRGCSAVEEAGGAGGRKRRGKRSRWEEGGKRSRAHDVSSVSGIGRPLDEVF